MATTHARIEQSITLIKAEAVLTGMIFAMPVLNIFFAYEIGMTPAQIGLSQAAFTAALLALNVPAGWAADRFSRRISNALGDMIAALGHFLYAFSHTFTHVVICEIIIGIGLALSTGADTGLLKSYADFVGRSYTTISSRIQELRPLGEMTAYIVGSMVGAFNPRIAIGMAAVTCVAGAVLSLYAVEVGERRVSEHHPLKDMAIIVHSTLSGSGHLMWNVYALSLSRNMTHAIIWVFTPLLLIAGVSPQTLGVAWAANTVAAYLGAKTAKHFALRLLDWQQFAIAIPVFVVASSVLSIHVGIVTVWLYTAFGWCRGWMGSVMGPIVQRHTPPDVRSTVDSVADSLGRVVYIPAVWGIGAVANHASQLAITFNMIVFAPLLVYAAVRLRRLS